MNPINKLITHNSSFHTDDVFACATLCLLLEKKGELFSIARTRDEEIIKNGDYVFDVGGIYDDKTNRFDHHQIGGAGRRENSIEYSSFGLVWKKFGAEVCGSERVASLVDDRLVAAIDAGDNGFDLVENKYEISPYFIQYFFHSMRPSWREANLNMEEMFLRSVEIAKLILSREIVHIGDFIMAEEKISEIYQNTVDKRIVVLDRDYSYRNMLNKFAELLFVIYPSSEDGTWKAGAVRKSPKTFKNKKDFPKAWAGLRDKELQKITNVPDATFCHRGLFLVVAKSKEGAIKLAKIAVES